MIKFFTAHVAVTQAKREKVERVTRGQSSTDDVTTNLWLSERRKHITSSVAATSAHGCVVHVDVHEEYCKAVTTEHGRYSQSCMQKLWSAQAVLNL